MLKKNIFGDIEKPSPRSLFKLIGVILILKKYTNLELELLLGTFLSDEDDESCGDCRGNWSTEKGDGER